MKRFVVLVAFALIFAFSAQAEGCRIFTGFVKIHDPLTGEVTKKSVSVAVNCGTAKIEISFLPGDFGIQITPGSKEIAVTGGYLTRIDPFTGAKSVEKVKLIHDLSTGIISFEPLPVDYVIVPEAKKSEGHKPTLSPSPAPMPPPPELRSILK